MKFKKKTMSFLVGLKNRQLRLEREKCRGLEEAKSILSAYLALLVVRHGSVRVPKTLVTDVLNNYEASVYDGGDDYVVTVSKKNGADLSDVDLWFEKTLQETPDGSMNG